MTAAGLILLHQSPHLSVYSLFCLFVCLCVCVCVCLGGEECVCLGVEGCVCVCLGVRSVCVFGG